MPAGHGPSAYLRLKQDYVRMKRDPVPYIVAEPLGSNILEWHYVVRGPENSLYEGGYYHGKLVFPADFPFKPPSIYMLTPNGRFAINRRLCLSMSDFHPDTWNPAWTVSTILTGLLSFMLESTRTFGSIDTNDIAKRQLASQSGSYNLKDRTFCELFPDVAKEIEAKLNEQTNKGRKITSLQQTESPADKRNKFYSKALLNIAFMFGFALFAYAVKNVVSCVMEDL